MRTLVISKRPEFNETGEVVLGQCEPYTSGWRLRLVNSSEDEEVLMEGTYYDLRRIQKQCKGMEPDEIRKAVEKAMEDASGTSTPVVMSTASTGAKANESTQILSADDVRKAMAEAEAAGERYEAPLNITIRREGPVYVISLPGGRVPLDEASFCRKIEETIGRSEIGVAIDLTGVPRLSSRMIKEFVRFKSLAEQRSRRFALAGAEETVMRVLELMNLEKVLPLYPSVTAASSAFTADTR